MKNLSPPSRIGFLLAGGKSSRMGTNKALLDFRGQTLFDRALSMLRSVCPDVVVVGGIAPLPDSPPVIADLYPGCGPLAGIHAALKHSSADLNLMLAVDMPFVSPHLLRFLLSVAENSDALVTVPRTAKGFQPLCAVYRREFLEIAEANLQAGKYKIDAAFSAIPLRIIDGSELSAAGFSEKDFLNVNTPEDLRAAEGLPSAH
jgi:molybdopterin-guanine dinucleotide biosynthesis protein A